MIALLFFSIFLMSNTFLTSMEQEKITIEFSCYDTDKLFMPQPHRGITTEILLTEPYRESHREDLSFFHPHTIHRSNQSAHQYAKPPKPKPKTPPALASNDFNIIVIQDIHSSPAAYGSFIEKLTKKFNEVLNISLHNNAAINARMRTLSLSFHGAVIDILKTLIAEPEKTIIIGHGLGALLAMHYIEQYPACGSMLINLKTIPSSTNSSERSCYKSDWAEEDLLANQQWIIHLNDFSDEVISNRLIETIKRHNDYFYTSNKVYDNIFDMAFSCLLTHTNLDIDVISEYSEGEQS